MQQLLPKLFLCALLIPAVAPAGDFNNLVNEFSRQTGAQQTKIPFFGLARFIVAVGHPAGTSELNLAIFENVHGRQLEFINTAESLVKGKGWNRIVRVRSNKGRGEATYIYMRPEGDRLRMLITTISDGEAVFVELRIKPDALDKFVSEHRGHRNGFAG
jgi:hypothetical protein